MRLFIDECLSPSIADYLNNTGLHEARHPLHYGGRGEPDHVVLERCIAADLVIVTENARDFQALIANAEIHPGLIILPCVSRTRSRQLLDAAIAYLHQQGVPDDLMVNRVLEVAENGTCTLTDLPN